MMQAAAKTNLLLIELSSYAGFVDLRSGVSDDSSYLHFLLSESARLLRSRQAFHELTDRLIKLAEHAYCIRDMKTVQEASLVLMGLPLEPARQLGQYYQALALKRSGEKAKAQALLESIADNAPLKYRARALQTMGTIYHEEGQLDDALTLYLESGRAALSDAIPNPIANLIAQSQVSFIRSDIGDHRGALTHLQSISSLAWCAARQSPFYFYAYHNALAVEFAALGRIAEAERACAIALASPLAAAYPEWSETRDEIAAKRKSPSPSTVAIHRAPETELAPQAESQRNAKLVVRFFSAYQASDKDFFQRSVLNIPARTTIALNAVSILHRVLTCIGPRAPPARS
jgi:tetratricopeptide (TPR) repeat protein